MQAAGSPFSSGYSGEKRYEGCRRAAVRLTETAKIAAGAKFIVGMKDHEQTTTNAKANAGVLPLRQTQGQNDKLLLHGMLFYLCSIVNLPD